MALYVIYSNSGHYHIFYHTLLTDIFINLDGL